MSNGIIIKNIIEKIKKGDEISPFLFLGDNIELLSKDVKDIGLSILKELGVPKIYFFELLGPEPSIKTSVIKDFLSPSNLTPPYGIQIFYIENVSKMTIGAANSCLKVFEEPGKANLILLSDVSESSILDTVLSRVQIKKLSGRKLSKKSDFFISMINSYINDNNIEILSYFFRNKLEKEEYISFLENLIIYSKENMIFIDYLFEINDDIIMCNGNNVNPKGVVDKWLLKIK